MTKYKLSILFVVLIAIGNINCSGKFVPAGDFYALIISDTHISRDESKDERMRELIDKINGDKNGMVHLVFNTGDAVSRIYGDYTAQNQDTSDDRLQRYVDIISTLDVPVYTALGNHDYKIGPEVDSDDPFTIEQIENAERLWQSKANIYPYYSIDYNGWKFIILNTMRGRYRERNFDPQQLIWLEAELNTNLPAVLLFHHPIETDNFKIWSGFRDLITPEKEPEFYRLCREHKKNIKAVFVGHGHRWVYDTLIEQIPVYETSSFADDEDSPFYLLGFDTVNFTIEIASSVSLPSDHFLVTKGSNNE